MSILCTWNVLEEKEMNEEEKEKNGKDNVCGGEKGGKKKNVWLRKEI